MKGTNESIQSIEGHIKLNELSVGIEISSDQYWGVAMGYGCLNDLV
jgi:hypothetical protein